MAACTSSVDGRAKARADHKASVPIRIPRFMTSSFQVAPADRFTQPGAGPTWVRPGWLQGPRRPATVLRATRQGARPAAARRVGRRSELVAARQVERAPGRVGVAAVVAARVAGGDLVLRRERG